MTNALYNDLSMIENQTAVVFALILRGQEQRKEVKKGKTLLMLLHYLIFIRGKSERERENIKGAS